jgi:hypothetical protein
MTSNAKKLTPETLAANPALAAIIRRRIAEIRQVQKTKANSASSTSD